MKKQICIVYEPCDEIKQGKSVITGDGSMIYVPSPSICPFSVYPYHWSFEIATSVVTENKYKLEHFLGNQVFLSCETAKLKNLLLPLDVYMWRLIFRMQMAYTILIMSSSAKRSIMIRIIKYLLLGTFMVRESVLSLQKDNT